MATVVEFLTELLVSVVDLVQIFLFDVALADPLSFVNFVAGAAFVTAALVGFGYLALGAVGRELGMVSPAPGRPRDQPVE